MAGWIRWFSLSGHFGDLLPSCLVRLNGLIVSSEMLQKQRAIKKYALFF